MPLPLPSSPPPPNARLSSDTVAVEVNALPHKRLVQRLADHRTEAPHVQDWGSAQDEAARRATLGLIDAVARGDVPAMWLAVHAGAALDAQLKPGVLPETRDKESRQEVPSLTTALGIAWWNQTHDEQGRLVARGKDNRALPNLGMVEDLLDAGAPAEGALLRKVEATSWEFHHAFKVLEVATLNRLAKVQDTGVHVPVEAVPGIPFAVGATSLHDRHLWSHRAVIHQRWDALSAWFERGGIVSTTTTERLLPLLWDQTPMNDARHRGGPAADQDAVLRAIDQATPALLAAEETVYRREMLGTLARVASARVRERTNPACGPAVDRAFEWLVGQLDKRAIDLRLTDHDTRLKPWMGTVTVDQMHAMGQAVEARLLHRTVDGQTTDRLGPGRFRVRL